MYCKRCGKDIANDSMFCQHCGANQQLQLKENRSNPATEFENNGRVDKKKYSEFFFINKRILKNSIILFLISITLVLIVLSTSSYILKPPHCQTRDLKNMIVNRDIEKIQIINNEKAEFFLTKMAIESGRYPKSARYKEGKPNFIYNIGDISSFKPFLLEEQKASGYNEQEIIYPIFKTRNIFSILRH
jgi:hypothetical protein